MDRSPQSSLPTDKFYVLKRGEILGPFTEAALREAVARGDFLPDDFVQREGLPIWQPLVRWLEHDGEADEGAIAPDWKSIATWSALRLHHDVLEGSIVIGLMCAGIGTAVAILARWPAALWLPWFALAVLAGVLAIRKGRVGPGLMVLLTVAVVPVLFSLCSRERRSMAVETTAEATPFPVKDAVQPEAIVSKATPSLLPEEVKAQTVTPPVVIERAAPAVPPVITPTATTATPGALPPSPIPDFPPLPDPKPRVPDVPAPATAPEGDLVQRYQGAFVLVNDAEGAGSGFICNAWGQTRLFTNIHVVAGMKQPRFTGLDGQRIIPGATEAAVGHDIMRFALAAAPAAPLELLTNVESNVKIGDDIVVLGNSGGGGVLTKLEGKLVGIGPDRIEVSAEFIAGNSGSPIIHVPTGKVIGLATYLTRRYDQFSANASASGAGTGPLVVRRFGFRLDSVPRWEAVNWAIFQSEAERIKRISQLTEDIFDFLDALRRKQTAQFATETLRRPATDWTNAIRGRRSDADRLKATQSFLASLRAMTRANVIAAETQLRYGYFRDELSKEREVRDKLYKAFDDDVRKLSTPVNTAY